jgi:HD-GYP domain-containing protein (c-di-GMP phosphodiesterase class II)
VGNIALPEGILKKPGLLTREEWSEIRKHPEIGYRIAESCKELAPISEGILAHHERWDGAGYPLKRIQHDIPLISRIISIVDAYDLMTHGCPYKSLLSPRAAVEELKREAGHQFDPELVEVFLKELPANETPAIPAKLDMPVDEKNLEQDGRI